MIKAIFFDIDGTLVSFKTHTVPQSTIKAIHEVRQKGVKVYIATGRPLPFIDNLSEVEYDGIISANGACLSDKQGKILFSKSISQDDVTRVTEYATKNNMCVTFATDETSVTINANDKSDAVFELLNLRNVSQGYGKDIPEGTEIRQIIAFFDKEQQKHIMSEVLTGCDAHRWHPDFADCIPKGISKATAIDEVIKILNIDIKETMAFGDGGNDIPMLRHAGVGIAMGNAREEVKKEADMVTESVDKDGISQILAQIDKF